MQNLNFDRSTYFNTIPQPIDTFKRKNYGFEDDKFFQTIDLVRQPTGVFTGVDLFQMDLNQPAHAHDNPLLNRPMPINTHLKAQDFYKKQDEKMNPKKKKPSQPVPILKKASI